MNIDNSLPDIYYVDLVQTIRTRLDTPNSDKTYLSQIADIDTGYQYNFNEENKKCFWSNLRFPYVPFLFFPNKQFIGSNTCAFDSTKKCNKWKGCHPFENPSAPFFLEATMDNVPTYINFPSISNMTIYFENYTNQIPNPDILKIPDYCTRTAFNELKEDMKEGKVYLFQKERKRSAELC